MGNFAVPRVSATHTRLLCLREIGRESDRDSQRETADYSLRLSRKPAPSCFSSSSSWLCGMRIAARRLMKVAVALLAPSVLFSSAAGQRPYKVLNLMRALISFAFPIKYDFRFPSIWKCTCNKSQPDRGGRHFKVPSSSLSKHT